MTSIKNENWTINEFISKITQGIITKPKYQRKKKWLDRPHKNNNKPNIKDYIDFLFKIKNSVHAITFGEKIVGGCKVYENIDGRINLISLGADREEGGEGNNADISLDNL